jgi:hypothetical protein
VLEYLQMGMPKVDSLQILVGQMVVGYFDQRESFSLSDLREDLEKTGITLTAKELADIFYQNFTGVVVKKRNFDSWRLAEDVTVEDLRDNVEILKGYSQRHSERY